MHSRENFVCAKVWNLIRQGGFDWGPIELDDVWPELIEKAVKKKFGK